jgi:CheY-like chemotaxis protein
MTKRKLLCVDDDSSIRSLYRNLLGGCGYEVFVAESGPHALNLLQTHEVDAIILDYEMPGMNGGEVAAEIKHRTPAVPILMVSGCPSVVDDAPRFVDAALAKGSPIDKLLGKLDMLIGTAAVHMTGPIPPARFAPLGSALASVALAVLVLQRIWS